MFWVTRIHLTRLQSCLLQPEAFAKCIKATLPSCGVGLKLLQQLSEQRCELETSVHVLPSSELQELGQEQRSVEKASSLYCNSSPSCAPERQGQWWRIYSLQGALPVSCSWLTGNRHKSDWAAQNSQIPVPVVLPGLLCARQTPPGCTDSFRQRPPSSYLIYKDKLL